MNTPDLLHAASQALSDGTPLHDAVAAWLTTQARDATVRIDAWTRTGQDVEGLTEAHYRHELAVARAAMAQSGRTTPAGGQT